MKKYLGIELFFLGLIIFFIAFLLGIWFRKNVGEKKIKSAEMKSDEIIKAAENKLADAKNKLDDAKNKLDDANKRLIEIEKSYDLKISDANKKALEIEREAILNAKEKILKMQSEAENEISKRQSELRQRENLVLQRENMFEQKRDILSQRENEVERQFEYVEAQKLNLEIMINQRKSELEKIAQLNCSEAKEIILADVKKEVAIDCGKIIKEAQVAAKSEADKKAKNILITAMQRCNIDHVTESTVSVVELPSDDMKGKIIGREGRNIRLLENLTGVDLIIDDTPEAIILSSFEPIRREIAKIALEKLVSDGRIHPARIEEVFEKAKQEMENKIFEEGETVSYELGIQDLNINLIKLLGKMKYRTSYGQNALKHSIEVANLCGIIAGELGLDILLAKRAGLLHDIGKAVDHEIDGSHIAIGVSLAKKYNEPEIIINAIESHHGDIEPTSGIAVIVQIADAISAARPGARRETLEAYIKRLEHLEKIACSFDGVEKSFAIHAGRELRIIVIPDKINDNILPLLAKDIAKKIESELEYPGQIKVTIIRETRAISYAT